MKKLLDYILNGRGIGIRYTLISSVMLAVVLGLFVRFGGTDLIPYAQQIADQVLPLNVSNGKVIVPADTHKIINLNFADNSSAALPLVIDTRSDTLDTTTLPDGIYLSRTAIYTINRNQTKITRLEGSFTLPRGDYREFFASALSWSALMLALFGSAFIFIYLFLLSLFYALCAIAVASVASKKYDFDTRMRLATVAFLPPYVFFAILGWFGQSLSTLAFFVVVIILEGLIIKKLPPQPSETTSAS